MNQLSYIPSAPQSPRTVACCFPSGPDGVVLPRAWRQGQGSPLQSMWLGETGFCWTPEDSTRFLGCLRWFFIFPMGNPPFGESIVNMFYHKKVEFHCENGWTSGIQSRQVAILMINHIWLEGLLFSNPDFHHVTTYGYGSIPINTIFSGMNIHLPAILMFTRGTRFWHTAIWWVVPNPGLRAEVTGGQGAFCFEDFWASEDGRQWHLGPAVIFQIQKRGWTWINTEK